LANAIASYSKNDNMIIMGSNGADNLSQFFFGSNTYDVIKRVKCPVLLVPEQCRFDGYYHILYPLTYKEKGKLALFQFSEFVKKVNARITFLHVSKSDTEVSRDFFKAERDEVEKYFEDTTKLYFERVISEDIDKAIDDFILRNPIDLMVVAVRERTVFQTIFGEVPLLSRLTALAPYPILIFHS